MKNILVALDFSDVSTRIIDMAAFQGQCTGAKIWLIHIAAPDPDFVGFEVGPKHIRDFRADELRKEHKQLQAYARRMQEEGTEAEALLVQGPTSETILEEIKRLEADMLIIGSHGHSQFYDLVVGSTTNEVLKESTIPVLVIPVERKKE